LAAERQVIQTDQKKVGLQTSSSQDAARGTLARSAVGKRHRDRDAVTPAFAVATRGAPRPANPRLHRWYYRVGRRVWFHEIRSFFVRDRREEHGPTLAEFWGAPQDAEENALQVPAKRQQRMLFFR
jgi:anaerobic magnesium-protoporphyrin IX monomethyl ester cyclase